MVQPTEPAASSVVLTESGQPPQPDFRQRIIRGGGAQLVSHLARVVVQFVMAGVLLPVWGLQLYGEWLILVGVAVFLAGSDFGFLTATVLDMNMAAAAGDHDLAIDAFRTVARGLAVVATAVFLIIALLVAVVPLPAVLGLKLIDHPTAAGILLMISVAAILLVSSTLLYGGFAASGHYGEAYLLQAAVTTVEFSMACVAAVLGSGPLLATAALLATRVVGTIVMYGAMRRRAPWLTLGRPSGRAKVRERLTRPALSLASIGWGTVLNVQMMVVVVGIVTGAASAAIFATLRTLSRVVLQLATSIPQAVAPEFGRAYAEGKEALISKLQRNVSQLVVWSSVLLIVVLVVFGGTIVQIWTRGHVRQAGILLDVLLVGAGIEATWLTAASVLIYTNRHVRIGLAYATVSVVGLPLAYLSAELWGRTGAALWLLLASLAMLAQVLRLALPATQETLLSWMGSFARPASIRRAVTALRTQLAGIRGS